MEWLIPLEEYIKAGVHVGTRIKTKDARKFISKIKEDGLPIIDITKIDKQIKIVSKFLAKYNPEQILVVGRRETAKKPLKMLSKYTGIKTLPGRYMPGMLTNTKLDIFKDVEVVFITDPILDKNALNDAFDTEKIIVSLVDTNNTLEKIDLAIPCNNKGARSLALIFWLITREYLRNRGILPKDGDLDVNYEAFMDMSEEVSYI